MERSADAIAHQEASIEIAATPETVYRIVSDLARMGEFSPESTGGRWLDDGSGQVGDWFEGTNRIGDFEWTREVQVAAADPGRDFTFVAGGVAENRTWWSYEMAPSATGTTLTEKWWVVNKPPVWQERSDEEFRARADATLDAIRSTLSAIKSAAENTHG